MEEPGLGRGVQGSGDSRAQPGPAALQQRTASAHLQQLFWMFFLDGAGNIRQTVLICSFSVSTFLREGHAVNVNDEHTVLL